MVVMGTDVVDLEGLHDAGAVNKLMHEVLAQERAIQVRRPVRHSSRTLLAMRAL